MRQLTFSGFLEAYVKALAGENTLALPRLAVRVQSEHRLAGPLLLWAATTRREVRLSRLLAARPRMLEDLQLLSTLNGQGQLEAALANTDPRLRPEYVKAWRSYVARRDAPARDEKLKLDVRETVLALEAEKNVSRYRMAKDLNLNPGNLHAYLALGRPNKLSLDRAFELLKYLKAA